MTQSPAASSCGVATTETNSAVAGGIAQVPFDGYVFQWRLDLWTSGGSHTYSLRILRPAGGGTYTGAGTGPPQTATSAGVNLLKLPTPLPVQAGDLIGFDCPGGNAPLGFTMSAPGFTYAFWTSPTLADSGMPRAPTNSVSGDEALVNADVAAKPSNAFSFGAVSRNKRKGTALLSVAVPNPGALALSGTGVKAQQAGGPSAVKTVSSAGTVQLLVKASGKAKRKLQRTGKATVQPSITYSPFVDIAGDPKTQSTTVKLVRRR